MNLKNYFKSIIGELLMNITDFAYRNNHQRFQNKLLSLFGMSCFPIESDASYRSKYGLKLPLLLQSDRKGVSYDIVYPNSQKVATPHYFAIPDLCCYKYNNVCITGNSDVVVDLDNNCVINDTCYNISDNVVFIDGLLYRHKNNHCILRSNFKKPFKQIKSGIMISGKFSNNYYHELFENLNRLMLIERADIPKDIPILVDAVVFKINSFQTIFEILKGDCQREVIVLKPNSVYKIDTLYTFSHINDITPHIRNYSSFNKDEKYFKYNEEYLRHQRDFLLRKKANIETPKRFFITRAKTKIRHFNEDAIFEVLEKYGFVKVAPEKYSFEEQMALFNNTDCIVGSTGAAFSNVLFCNEKCSIICFLSGLLGNDPPIFNSIANIVGAHFCYYPPDKVRNKKSIHTDFYVDPTRFENYINTIL